MTERTVISRRWMLTINNPTFLESQKLYDLGHSDLIDCLVYGAEHVDEGTPHFQIYLHFKGNQRFNRIKAIFPRADIEVARKPKLACCRYCAKEGFYYAFGNVPDLSTGCRKNSQAAANKAADLAREEVVKRVMRGELRMVDLSAEQLLDQKLVKACERAASMIQGPMRPDVYVCCFVSPTGWGKSYSIWETFLRVASVEFGASQEWFLDAEQEVMLFDEFCGQVRCQKMLRYLDRYPISLPIKGGHRPCYWKLVFICSNTPPDEWYMKDDPKTGIRTSSIPDHVRQALYRRIGYGNFPDEIKIGETHVYDPAFTNLEAARREMKGICVRLHERLYPKAADAPNAMDDPDQVQAEQEAERQEIRRLEQHGIHLDQIAAQWDAERASQRQLEARQEKDFDEPEYESLPDQPPEAEDEDVPTQPDTCPSPPKDDDDDDFED